MNQEEKYNYWLDTAVYDMESAKAMFNTGRLRMFRLCASKAWRNLQKGFIIIL
jgi:hypothetical protein